MAEGRRSSVQHRTVAWWATGRQGGVGAALKLRGGGVQLRGSDVGAACGRRTDAWGRLRGGGVQVRGDGVGAVLRRSRGERRGCIRAAWKLHPK